MIRDFEPADAEGIAEIVHQDDPPQALTPAGIRHWLVAQPERARARLWVAEEESRIVGWAEARLRWSTSAEGLADFWAFVAPGSRRAGLGAALFDRATGYLAEIGARVLETWSYSPAGAALLGARGFRVTGTERVSVLDPGQADTSALDVLAAEKKREGFRLVRLAEVFERVAELHEVYAAASADVPEYFPEDDIRLEEWRRETLEHPQLTREGSFVVCAGDRPVALAFLEVDEPALLGANELTGTLPEFRRRGLARLAKLTSIRWAAERGLTAIWAANAEKNVGMVRLNESLGYRPVHTEGHYIREGA
jgi:GNAT superfamily N-acetyltransferase